MKKMKGLLLAATLMLAANGLIAQTYSETALMFSRTRSAGSARMLGMGGAQISLGGDFSSASSNPAGLGMFNRSEFSISPGYFSLQNKGNYFSGDNQLSTGNSDTRTSLNIPGFGLIFSRPQNGDNGFIHGTFGITMTKINDFNSNIQYKGENPNTSLIDYFLDQATGGTPDQFSSDGALVNTPTQLGYDNYLIGESTILDPNNDPTTYFTDVDGIPFQNESIQTKGGQNQWSFSYGANFNDKFFLGAGIGIVSLNYQSKKIYSEEFADGPLINYSLTEDLQIRGTGINLTVGAIGRPLEGLQIGASVTTPTRYNLTDTYSASMRSNWDNFQYDDNTVLNNERADTDILTSGYTMMTPWKLAAGASYIFGKRGLVSVDVEQLNYGNAKYNSTTTGVSYDADNEEISNLYASTLNIRAGGEVRVEAFRFRAGFGYMPDPYRSVQNDQNRSFMTGSAGVGYRAKSFFLDLAVVKGWGKSTYRPYTVNSDNSPLLRYDQTLSNVVATVGFTF